MASSTKEPDLALAGLALLLFFAFMIWHDQPIKSNRQTDLAYQQISDRKIQGSSYESWSWEDPFEYNPVTEQQCKNADVECLLKNIITQAGKQNPPPLVIFYFLENILPDTLDLKESRIRQRNAAIAALIESDYRPIEPNQLYFHVDNLVDTRWESYAHTSDENRGNVSIVWVKSSGESKKNFIDQLLKESPQIYPTCPQYIYLIDTSSKTDNGPNCFFIAQKELINKLKEELIEKRKFTNPSEIAIVSEISEQDKKIAGEFCKNFNDPDCKEIKNYTYLKGLDAYQQSAKKKSQDEEEKAEKKWDDRFSLIDQHNLPVGPSRLDYLHRLAVEIKNTHYNLEPHQRIKAVGVFGSDFNDKLLIFQALRREMPNIVLFTTELDAQMFYPEYWRWTRNLIVASHFDLKLNETYQKHIPPFRDSQQTALYFATLVALGKDVGLNESNAPKAKIFEIGRNGPVYLGEKSQTNEIDPNYDDAKQLRTIGVLLFLTTVVVILFLKEIRPNSGGLIIWLGITAVSFFLGWLIALFDPPFSLFDGISLWPTIFIRIIACSLAISFFIKAVITLEGNFSELGNSINPNLATLKYINIIPTDDHGKACLRLIGSFIAISSLVYVYANFQVGSMIGLTILGSVLGIIAILSSVILILKATDSSNHLKVESNLKGLILLLLLFIIGLTLIVIVFASFEINLLNDREMVQWLLAVLSILITFTYYIVKVEEFKNIKEWAEGKNDSQLLPLDKLWKDYHSYGRLRQRMLRVVAMWLFFIALAVILDWLVAILLPIWPSPCRDWSCFIDLGIQVLSFIAIMLLTLFVLDALRLCFYWIQKLRINCNLLADEGVGWKYRFSLQEFEALVILVAKRTQVVDRLIYYPLIAIMLMLFARINYFDNLDFPLALAITFGVSITLLFFAGFKLREEAALLRERVIERLEQFSGRYSVAATSSIEKIRSIDYGAFNPMLEQPVLRGLLLMLASLGVFASEYIMVFW